VWVWNGSAWVEAVQPSVYDGGTWKDAIEIWVYDNGAWRSVWAAGPSAPPSGLTLTEQSTCIFADPTPDYRVLVEWTNGDVEATTEVRRGGVLVHTATAGATSWLDDTPGTGSVSYEIRHVKNGIDSTSASDTISVSTLACAPAGDPTPGTFLPSKSCTLGDPNPNYELTLNWTNADAYSETQIRRDGVVIHYAAAGVTQWVDTNAEGGLHTYRFTHRYNGVFSGAVNQGYNIIELNCAPTGAPTIGTLSPSSSCTLGNSTPEYQVTVNWTNADSFSSTEIRRGGVLVHTANPGITQWVDTVASSGLNSYALRHTYNNVDSTDDTKNVTVTSIPCAPTGSPSNLVATDASSCGSGCVSTYEVDLSWTNGDATSTTNIYRGGVFVTSVGSGVSTYTDTGPSSAATYNYEVKHEYNDVESSGATDSVVVANPCVVPQAPVISVYATSSTNVRIEIADPGGISSWKIYRDGSGTPLTTLNDPTTTYDDSGRTAETEYCYDVEAIDSNGCTSAQSSGCATTPAASSTAPTSFAATQDQTACPDISIDLSWDLGGNTTTSLVLDYSTNGGTSWTNITTLSAGSTTYNNHDPNVEDQSVQYRIRFSDESEYANTTIFPVCYI